MDETGRRIQPEFEITPAMLAEGVDALCLFRLSEDQPEDIVEAVFRAMRPLEGRFSPLVDECLPSHGDCNFSTKNERRIDEQALCYKRATHAIYAVVLEFEHPLGRE